jgi:hypothetical protein
VHTWWAFVAAYAEASGSSLFRAEASGNSLLRAEASGCSLFRAEASRNSLFRAEASGNSSFRAEASGCRGNRTRENQPPRAEASDGSGHRDGARRDRSTTTATS